MYLAVSAQDLLASQPRRLGGHVTVLDQAASTSDLLLCNADVLPDGAIASAEWQSAGRGQFRRPWLAAPRSSILLSILLHEPLDTPLLSRAAVFGAHCAAKAIEGVTGRRPALRWPNDLLFSRRKVGGVLAETKLLTNGQRAVVIGIGINVNQLPQDFPPELPGATSLRIECGAEIDRCALAGALIARLDEQLVDGSFEGLPEPQPVGENSPRASSR